MNPMGKVPTLETPEGALFESNAIARYVARLRADTQLMGSSFMEAGLVEQWIDYSATALDLPIANWVYPVLGYMPFNPGMTKKAKDDVSMGLALLDGHLLRRSYLVGHQVTLADIVMVCSLHRPMSMVFDAKFRAQFPNVTRWFTTCINQPEFQQFYADFKLCEVAQEAKPPPKKVKAKKPKANQQPKKKAPKEDDGEEAAPKPAKKEKSKLESLPKPKMVFDEWKRKYSNSDTRGAAGALPWLWENVDMESYCFFHCEYKYNEELTKAFMCCNLINGWFQRLDNMHKYGFGNVHVFGEDDKDLSISGVWMFRGKELPDIVLACDDTATYDFKPLDHTKAEDKEMIEDYFAWDGKLGGRTFNSGKVFK